MKLTLNLASRTYINRRALYALYAALATMLVLLLALNLGFYIRSRGQVSHLKVRLGELERESAERRSVAAEFSQAAYDRLLEDIAFANGLLERDAFRWTALFGRLEEVVPDKVIVRGIQPDYKTGSLKLTGEARRVRDLRRFLDNLISSPHFSDVYLFQQSREAAGQGNRQREGVAFSIVVRGAF